MVGMRTRARVLVSIATYNERDNLPSLLDALWRSADVDVLVVDDSSPDGTGFFADAVAARDNRLTVVHRPSKAGLASARIVGFRYAIAHNYDHVIEMDADFSHSPEDVPALLAATEKADVVVGSRLAPGGAIVGRSWRRDALTHLGSAYARWILRLKVRDCTGGFRCSHTNALRLIDFELIASRGYGFEIELNWAWSKARVRFAEIPIVFRERVAGSSKLTRRIILEALMVVLRLRLGQLPPALRAVEAEMPSLPAQEHYSLRGRVAEGIIPAAAEDATARK